MTTTSTSTEPAVWVGCLACYNEGRLAGTWIPAIDAEDVTVAGLHRGTGIPVGDHEELWCLDTEHFPRGTGEMSPHDAAEYARTLAAIDEHERGAYLALCSHEREIVDPGAFRERFAGAFDDVAAFAEHWAAETDMMDHWPDQAVRYFDWRAFARDLAFDLDILDGLEGGVFVFHQS